ncbi:CIA30 family protein [Sunxiuqinia sp. sy24]|uniref:CIA30 family protein n=1 Tax=Sunxiuqinia sp. sy24 TaxID=3461495 RepID=UPI00404646A5
MPYLIMLLLLTMTNPLVLFDFSKTSELSDWTVVNDDVMGGRSTSSITLDPEGNGVFEGTVSLENNGGFSSVRYRTGSTNIAGLKKVGIRLKGDGKRYQFRVKAKASDYFSYVGYFQTSGEWQLVEISLQNLYPAFRGRRLSEPNFSGDSIEEIAILIGNNKNEAFKLELDQIIVK